MKNVLGLRTFGIIALVAIIGFAMIGCGDDGGGNSSSDAPELPGTITISPSAATVGTKLTATYSGTEDVSYQWKHSAANVGTDSNEFTPSAVGSYTVTVSAAGFKSKTSAAVNVTEAGGIVGDGSVTISGSAVVGQTLTAITNNLGGTGSITYEWKNSSDDVIGTESTYVIKESDVGFTITVTVTRSGLLGPVTSSSTGQVIDQPDYGISLNPSINHNFGTALAGTPMEPYEVVITNIGKQATGALSINLTGADAANFVLSTPFASSIAPGITASFTIVPSTDINTAKIHQVMLTVSNTEITTNNNFLVSFTSTLATVNFDSAGGSAVAQPTLTNLRYGTIVKPADPEKEVTTITEEGLYFGTYPNCFYDFNGWFAPSSSEPFDFENTNITGSITLTAGWSSIDVGDDGWSSFFDLAIDYISENPAIYTLALANDYESNLIWLTSSDIKLNIIGLGSERKISSVFNSGIFYVGGELTLRNNITLVGANNAMGSAVSVGAGAIFTMHEGSKVTGNIMDTSFWGEGGGVTVNQNGIFYMYGGEISGNKATNAGGGVAVASGIFRIINGTIYGSEASESLANNAGSNIGAALVNGAGTVEHGTFVGGTWTSQGSLTTTNNTIIVVNGVLQ